MSERHVIMMGGAPGSGTSRLGKVLEQHLWRHHASAEHISVGNRIRAIGSGVLRSVYTDTVVNHLNSDRAFLPIDDDIMYGLVSEVLLQSEERDIILLDGYPRYEPQAADIQDLAVKDERSVTGMIVTQVDEETSLARMIKRGQKNHARAVSLAEACWRLDYFNDTFPATLTKLRQDGMPIVRVDSHGSKPQTDIMGIEAVHRLLTGAPEA